MLSKIRIEVDLKYGYLVFYDVSST